MSNARSRQRRPGRRLPFRDVKPRILVVSEGKFTEPEYIHGFARACRNPRVVVEVASEHGVPRTVVEIARDRKKDAEHAARREKDDNLVYESVWAVFDIDDHPNIGEAKEMARDNNIHLAISNPCVELWLLLHFQDNPGMQDRARIKKLLSTHVLNYDKHVNYAAYSAGYSEAVNRSKQMDEAALEATEPGRNPTTGVYQLTEIIRGESTTESP
jgi:hypothetical protein